MQEEPAPVDSGSEGAATEMIRFFSGDIVSSQYCNCFAAIVVMRSRVKFKVQLKLHVREQTVKQGFLQHQQRFCLFVCFL